MPHIIEHIDKIARDKNRTVLYIIFDRDIFPDYNYDEWSVRKKTLSWFEENDVELIPCGPVARETGFESYRGQLYIDVPYDENNKTYQKVSQYLENSDGSMRIKGVVFCYLPLERAMKNKHHDEPGFWDRWAEKF